jgi:hypothetical protein
MASPRLLVVAALAAVTLLASCSDDDPTTSSTTTPGETTTTAAAGEVSTTSTAGEDPEPARLVLRGDGVGVADLGAVPDEAVAAVAGVLGEATVDTGWQPSFGAYGTCPGEQIRAVEWDHLVLLFTDGTTDEGEGQHLFAWRVTGAPPAIGTESGFGFGATAADAEELYPGKVQRFPAEEPFPAFLEIDAAGGPITAFLDDQDRVTNLEAGTPCGE